MRMRRKRNLDDRLAQCGQNLIIPKYTDPDHRSVFTETDYIDTAELFGRDAPLWLEIGCGKGGFTVECAKRNPDVNFLAVEKCANVLVQACERAIEEKADNVKFLKCGAEYLPRYIKPSSVDRIYLNFSCPYPPNRCANRRLTNPKFLDIYKLILSPDAEIHQKTDNQAFFEYSLEQFSQCGFSLKNISLDLHNSGFEGNIVTEYESKFAAMGMRIYRLEAYLGTDGALKR